MKSENIIETDVLVIGGGVAGCFAAIKAKEQGINVTLVDKNCISKSGASISTTFWQVYNPEWHPDIKTAIKEISKRGEYLNNHEWGEILLNDSWSIYTDLLAWGAKFPVETSEIKDWYAKNVTRTFSTEKKQTSVVYPFGVFPILPGAIMSALRKQALSRGVKLLDRIMIVDLLKQDGKVVGAIGFSIDSQELYVFKAKSTIMAGGNNNFKSPGYNVNFLTGDADAMSYRVGAVLTGREIPDLHFALGKYPAWRALPVAHFWYLSDAEGKYIPSMDMDLYPAFTIHAGKGPVSWDLRTATDDDMEVLNYYAHLNPIYENKLERIGLDMNVRGTHRLGGGCGAGNADVQTSGIWPIDKKCASNVPGLYAAGDCCCTWCWGALNDGAPWGMTIAAVTGARAGQGAAEYALKEGMPQIDDKELAKQKENVYLPVERQGGFSPRWVTQQLQNTMMPYYILHIKHEVRLKAALSIIEFQRDHLVPMMVAKDAHELRAAHETRNMVLNAEMMLRAALYRTESRGRHYREDYPRRDDPNWLAWIKMRNDEGQMKLWKEPIPQTWWPDLAQPYEERYPKRFPGE